MAHIISDIIRHSYTAEAKYFRGFFIGKLRIFYHRSLGILKDDKIVYNNFFGKLKMLLHLGFP